MILQIVKKFPKPSSFPDICGDMMAQKNPSVSACFDLCLVTKNLLVVKGEWYFLTGVVLRCMPTRTPTPDPRPLTLFLSGIRYIVVCFLQCLRPSAKKKFILFCLLLVAWEVRTLRMFLTSPVRYSNDVTGPPVRVLSSTINQPANQPTNPMATVNYLMARNQSRAQYSNTTYKFSTTPRNQAPSPHNISKPRTPLHSHKHK